MSKLTREQAFEVYLQSLSVDYVSFLVGDEQNIEQEKKKFDMIWDLIVKIYTTDGGKS